jgi:hypothetical protein
MTLLVLALALGLSSAAFWSVAYPTFLRGQWNLIRSPWAYAAIGARRGSLSLEAYRAAIEARLTGDPTLTRALIDVSVPAIKRDLGWTRYQGLALMSRTVAAVAPVIPFRASGSIPGLGWILFGAYVLRHWYETARERARLQAYLLRVWRAA